MKINKKFLIVFSIVIVVILIIIAILSSFIKKDTQPKVEEKNDSEGIVYEGVKEGVITPQNTYMFFGKYINGVVTSSELEETISTFTTKTIPTYYSELKYATEGEINEFYEANETKIKELMKVEEKEDFLKFIKMLQTLDTANLEIEAIGFKETSFTHTDISTTAKLKVKYKGNNEIEFTIKVYRKNQENKRNIVFYK